MNTEQALEKYKVILDTEQAVRDKIAADLETLAILKRKAQNWLLKHVSDVEAPEWLLEADPRTFWAISKKTDGVAGTVFMYIKEHAIPAVERPAEAEIDSLKAVQKQVELWALDQMLERKSDSFDVRGVCRCSRRTDVKYNIVDKSLFVNDAVNNGYISEITVSVRPNSKLMKQLVEERGELPAGVQSYKEYKANFTKSEVKQ